MKKHNVVFHNFNEDIFNKKVTELRNNFLKIIFLKIIHKIKKAMKPLRGQLNIAIKKYFFPNKLIKIFKKQ